MNVNQLTMGARIVAASALLLFIDSLLPWFRICSSDILGGLGANFPGLANTCGSHNGWSNALSLIGVLVAIVMLVQIGLELAKVELPRLGAISWSQAQLVAGGLVLLLVALQVLVGNSPLHRYFGAYLGLVLAIGVFAGAVLRYREAPQSRPIAGHGHVG